MNRKLFLLFLLTFFVFLLFGCTNKVSLKECEAYPDLHPLKDLCYYALAGQDNDVAMCDKISESSSIKRDCLEALAIKNNDVEICYRTVIDIRIESCVLKLALLNDDVDLCVSARCFMEFAKEKNDLNYCKKIIVDGQDFLSADIKRRCLSYFDD